MRLIDADATVKYLKEFRCKDCDRRKGMKNGKIQFCYEIGDAPCRACDIGDTIDYFLEEDISPTVDAIPVVRCKDCRYSLPSSENVILCTAPCESQYPKAYKPIDWYCAGGERKDGDGDV